MLSLKARKILGNFTLDVSWEMDRELMVLFGPSGAGKTITLQMLAGLLRPDEGRIVSGDRVFFDSASGIDLPPQERSLGYVFQDRALFPHMTVRQNIGYGVLGVDQAAREAMVRTMIETFHLEDVENKHPSQISGGQKQRVTLARALIGRPEALLLDEPFSALDNNLHIEMRQLLRGIRRDFNVPIILITHDLLEAYTLADNVVIYSAGRVIQVGTPEQLFNRTSNPDLDLSMVLNLPFLIGQASDY
jgi:molybdate transport system ATP-binding protein